MRNHKKIILLILIAIVSYTLSIANTCDQKLIDTTAYEFEYESLDGRTIRLQFYSDHVVRVQWAAPGEEFFSDDHYEMVEKHIRSGRFTVSESDDAFFIETGSPVDGLKIELLKQPLRLIFSDRKTGYLPVFIKEGAIIPRYHFALSTLDLNATNLLLDIYTGENARFTLYEDDGITEKFRARGELRKTEIQYLDQSSRLIIKKSEGNYEGASSVRNYELVFHGMADPATVKLNQTNIKREDTLKSAEQNRPSYYWDEEDELLKVFLDYQSVHTPLTLNID